MIYHDHDRSGLDRIRKDGMGWDGMGWDGIGEQHIIQHHIIRWGGDAYFEFLYHHFVHSFGIEYLVLQIGLLPRPMTGDYEDNVRYVHVVEAKR